MTLKQSIRNTVIKWRSLWSRFIIAPDHMRSDVIEVSKYAHAFFPSLSVPYPPLYTHAPQVFCAHRFSLSFSRFVSFLFALHGTFLYFKFVRTQDLSMVKGLSVNFLWAFVRAERTRPTQLIHRHNELTVVFSSQRTDCCFEQTAKGINPSILFSFI